MTMLPFRPQFDYSTSSSLVLTIPSRIWRFSNQAIGGGALSATRVGASYEITRDELVDIRLRFYEGEWPDVLTMLQYAQAWPNTVTLYFDQLVPGISYTVQLRHPMMGEVIAPEISDEYPEVRELDTQWHKVSGAAWDDLWFNYGLS